MKAKDSKTANLIPHDQHEDHRATHGEGFHGHRRRPAHPRRDLDLQEVDGEGARLNAGERGKEQLADIDFEVAWCNEWLPQHLSEAELRDAVAKAVLLRQLGKMAA
jgi:hypothetical protein